MIASYEWELILKISIAFVVGIVIGYDRQRADKPAGIRTQMLICVGSTLLAGISVHINEKLGIANVDPTRIMAQIITGIGFVGAGVILKGNRRITGVTTAATLWTTSAIGVAIGAGFYVTTAVAVIMVLMLEPLSHLQYFLGIKNFAYSLKVPIKELDQIKKILETMQINFKLNGEEEELALLTIFSFDQRNIELVKKIDQENISYYLDREDE